MLVKIQLLEERINFVPSTDSLLRAYGKLTAGFSGINFAKEAGNMSTTR